MEDVDKNFIRRIHCTTRTRIICIIFRICPRTLPLEYELALAGSIVRCLDDVEHGRRRDRLAVDGHERVALPRRVQDGLRRRIPFEQVVRRHVHH